MRATTPGQVAICVAPWTSRCLPTRPSCRDSPRLNWARWLHSCRRRGPRILRARFPMTKRSSRRSRGPRTVSGRLSVTAYSPLSTPPRAQAGDSYSRSHRGCTRTARADRPSAPRPGRQPRGPDGVSELRSRGGRRHRSMSARRSAQLSRSTRGPLERPAIHRCTCMHLHRKRMQVHRPRTLCAHLLLLLNQRSRSSAQLRERNQSAQTERSLRSWALERERCSKTGCGAGDGRSPRPCSRMRSVGGRKPV